MGMVLVACLAAFAPRPVTATITSTLLSTSSLASAPEPFGPFRGKTVLQLDSLAFDVAKIAKCFRQRAQIDLFLLGVGSMPKDADARHRFPRLGAGSKRPDGGHADDKRDESAPFHFRSTPDGSNRSVLCFSQGSKRLNVSDR